MFRSGFHLETTEQLMAAQYNKTPITVWQQGLILDYGGPIEEISEQAVSINGVKYLRAMCEFRIR
jgi:hypothetical protein